MNGSPIDKDRLQEKLRSLKTLRAYYLALEDLPKLLQEMTSMKQDESEKIIDESVNEKVPVVTVTLKEYQELIARSDFLSALENNGVVNWSGYGEARKQFLEDYPDADIL